MKLVDANTVAIMPLNPLTPGPSPPEYRGRGEEYASLHLVFAADGNLRERRIVAMPKGKTLLRQIFHQDGSIEWKNADDKALATQTRTVAPAKAPDLTPNVRELVVAHMPIRTWQHIFAQADKVSPETKYAPKIVEQWFIAECMDSSRDNLHRLRTFVQFFHAKGDRRLGFYTLINAAEIYIDNRHLTAPDGKTYSINVEKEHPNSPLAMFLAHSQRELASDTSPAKELPGPKDGFIQRMARFRNIWLAWHNQKVTADAMPTELAKVHAHLEDTPSPLFAYAVLDAMERRGNKAPSAHMTDIALKRFGPISDPLGLGYVFRYEHARALWQAGRAPEAIKLLKDLHADTLKLGVLPPIDAAFRETLQLGDVKFIPFARQTLDDLLSKKRYGLAFQLARQMEQLGDVALADEFVNTVLAKSPDEHRPTLTLVGIQHFTHRRDFAQADRLLGKLLEDKKLSGLAGLWRWRAGIARSYNQSAASLSYLEKALDLEYRELPELVDLESFRAEYRGLLEQYQKVAEAHVMLEKSAPKAFLAKVIRTADRWRRIDADNSEPSRSAGKIFHTLGERELAWDYWTAPIDLHPAESAPWLELAQTLQNEGDLDRADQAFAFAFEAETSNPEILWQRAMNLVRMDRPDRARQIYRQIATGQWQERFAATVERARGLAER
ncbi:MAG: hypothetical protein HY289_03500 [Planctomycetes bacterium]|nr:hypothetical protein [Planctomycetota bacterium]